MKIAREGLVPTALLAGAGGLCYLFSPWAALPWVPLLLFTLWFFRDPERQVPADSSAAVSPADGRVIKAGAGEISVFMNVFDVHVCRAPVAGRVTAVERFPGKFLAAWHDAASEHNERVAIDLDEAGRPVRFVLVAGLVARRIVCRLKVGDALARGQRVGLIRFGSRVDVRLPADYRPAVRVGERVRAGETVIARRPADD